MEWMRRAWLIVLSIVLANMGLIGVIWVVWTFTKRTLDMDHFLRWAGATMAISTIVPLGIFLLASGARLFLLTIRNAVASIPGESWIKRAFRKDYYCQKCLRRVKEEDAFRWGLVLDAEEVLKRTRDE